MRLGAKTNLRRNLALVATSVAVALVLGEAFTRVYLRAQHEGTGAPLIAKREHVIGKTSSPSGAPTAAEQHGQYEDQLDLHPFFGFVYKPGTYIGSHNPDAPHGANRWGFQTYHDIGLCGDRYCVDNEPDRKKLLVIGILGGSFAHFVGDFGEHLEGALERAFPGRKVVVLNLAQGGHAFPQALNIYTYFRDVIDVPVFLDGLNELWNPIENNRAGIPPEYAKGAHFRALTELAAVRSVDRLRSERRIEELKSRIRVATELSLSFGIRNSALVFLAWNAVTGSWANQIQDEIVRVEKSFEKSGPFFDVPEKQIVSLAARQWEEYHKLLAGIARQQGVPSIHLLQPNPFVPGSKELSKEEDRLVHTQFFEDEIRGPVRTGYPLLRASVVRLKSQGVLAEDLTQLYKGMREDIWIDGCHPNARGTYLVLDRVAALIKQIGLPGFSEF